MPFPAKPLSLRLSFAPRGQPSSESHRSDRPNNDDDDDDDSKRRRTI